MNENLPKEFRKILRHFERELSIQNQSSCCCGVTITQCHTLMELDKNDHMTLNDLSSRLYLDDSTVSRTVDNLVKKGILYRTIPPNNRRITIISLTGDGKSVCNKINNGNDSYYREVLKVIPENQISDFLSLFEALANSMFQQNRVTSESEN